jgi:hypothetical protein
MVVAIAGGLAALAFSAFGRQKPRQKLNAHAIEFRSRLHGARQAALASGKPLVLMVFPDLVTSTGTGRLILYQDGDGNFFSTAAAVSFEEYDPTTTAAGALSEVLEVIDLPANVRIGPADGMGSAAVLRAPFAGIAVNNRCGFCTGDDGRGAIVFDALGSVTFQDRNGPALALPAGASISFRAEEPDLASTAAGGAEVRTFAIAATTGAIRSLSWSP